MKKIFKNLLENSRIALNIYKRQKYSTKNNEKEHKTKFSSSFTCFTMSFALAEKYNNLKDFGYSVTFDTIYLTIWFIDMASKLYRR